MPQGDIGPYVLQYSNEVEFPPGNRQEKHIKVSQKAAIIDIIQRHFVPFQEEVLYFRLRLHPSYEFSITNNKWTVKGDCGDFKYFNDKDSTDFYEWNCTTCPKNGNCTRGSFPHALPGTWRIPWEPDVSKRFMECPYENACEFNESMPTCGMKNGTCSQCQKGTTGVLCAICDDEHSRSGTECVFCDGSEKNATGFIQMVRLTL